MDSYYYNVAMREPEIYQYMKDSATRNAYDMTCMAMDATVHFQLWDDFNNEPEFVYDIAHYIIQRHNV